MRRTTIDKIIYENIHRYVNENVDEEIEWDDVKDGAKAVGTGLLGLGLFANAASQGVNPHSMDNRFQKFIDKKIGERFNDDGSRKHADFDDETAHPFENYSNIEDCN